MHKLTPYPTGSIKEVATVALPLMISALSINLMMALNRYNLAHYSIDAVNAAAFVDMICFVFHFSLMGVTAIAEVFAGQYYGSSSYENVPIAVWQMVWLSLIAAVIFSIFGNFGGPLIIPENIQKDALPYFKWMMSFVFMHPLITALASFFIAQGKSKIIFWTSLLSNAFCFVLSYQLINGGSISAPLGAEGAAIATVVAQSAQVIVLFIVFLSKKNRQTYYTHRAYFNLHHFKECIKIGAPNGVNYVIEYGGWALIAGVLTIRGKDFMTVRTIAQTLFILLGFISNGIQKTIIALCSNLIGSNQMGLVHKTLRSATIFMLLISITTIIPLCINIEYIATIFLGLKLPPDVLNEVAKAAYGISLFFILDSLAWIFIATLTSGGDTRFVMLMNTSASWICVVIPGYIWLKYLPCDPSSIWVHLSPLYAFVNLTGLYLRYRSKKWQNKIVDTNCGNFS
jgi:MATE family multidrug resistance protein